MVMDRNEYIDCVKRMSLAEAETISSSLRSVDWEDWPKDTALPDDFIFMAIKDGECIGFAYLGRLAESNDSAIMLMTEWGSTCRNHPIDLLNDKPAIEAVFGWLYDGYYRSEYL